jgi:hypothetical protein
VSEDRKTTRGLDPELKAMAAIFDVLSGLNNDERCRVLLWVLQKAAPPGFNFSCSESPGPSTEPSEN